MRAVYPKPVGLMPNRPRSKLDAEARRRLAVAVRAAGEKVRAARLRRGWTQRELGQRVGITQSAVSQIELGLGAALSLLVWERLSMALELPLRFEFGRDARERPADAGHLDMQELVLRIGRQTGRIRRFELPSRVGDWTRWTDVGLRDDRDRYLILTECVNTIDNVGASIRSSDQKKHTVEELAAAMAAGHPYSVHVCWIVRDTRRNRALLASYPELFASRFPGSSREWIRALVQGGRPPLETGLVWCDMAATKLFEWRPRAA